MKIVEIMGGIQLPITNEEAEVLEKFTETPQMPKTALTEREIYLANQLVIKNVLYRRQHDGKIEYFRQAGN